MNKGLGVWNRIVNGLLSSFDNKTTGFSGRKLSAFIGVVISISITIAYTCNENLKEILTIWLLFSLLCLGIITVQQIIELKNGVSQQSEDTTDTLKE